MKSLSWWPANNLPGKSGISARLCLMLFLLLAAKNSFGFGEKLSAEAKVSVVTVAPGEDLYSVFGHTLLWVYDPVNQIDKAYSYGTFDFNTQSFYWKFIRGTLPYTISYATLGQNVDFYRFRENREMKEQILNLSLYQKQRIYDYLETNLLPENREYQYKFFYDNCSTRIRDAVLNACSDSLHLQPIRGLSDSTYRQWMNKCLKNKNKLWEAVGMNIGLGQPADEVAMQFNACYLPENLMKSLSQARRMTNGRVKMLVWEEQKLFNAVPMESPKLSFWLSPGFILSLVFVITVALTYFQHKREDQGYWFDKILFSIAGLVGWVLVFLWFGTDHGVTSWNRNLFWLMPLHLPLIFFIRSGTPKNIIGYYFFFTGLMICAGLFFVVQYSIDTVPWVCALFVRAIYHAGFEPESRVRIKKRTRKHAQAL